MRVKIIIFCLFLSSTVVFGQINIDSLKNGLDEYIKVKSTNQYKTWTDYNIKYLNKDSLKVYEIFYDSNGEIKNDAFDIAIYHYKYDEKNRCIESYYFNETGKLQFSDSPPIQRIFYDDNDKIIRIDYFGVNHRFFSRFEYEYDEFNRETKLRWIDKNNEIKKEVHTKYRQGGKVLLRKTTDKNGELILNYNGSAILYEVYETTERKKLVELRFLDKDEQLIMIKNHDIDVPYSYKTYTWGLRDDMVFVKYYDINSNKVFEGWHDIPVTK